MLYFVSYILASLRTTVTVFVIITISHVNMYEESSTHSNTSQFNVEHNYLKTLLNNTLSHFTQQQLRQHLPTYNTYIRFKELRRAIRIWYTNGQDLYQQLQTPTTTLINADIQYNNENLQTVQSYIRTTDKFTIAKAYRTVVLTYKHLSDGYIRRQQLQRQQQQQHSHIPTTMATTTTETQTEWETDTAHSKDQDTQTDIKTYKDRNMQTVKPHVYVWGIGVQTDSPDYTDREIQTETITSGIDQEVQTLATQYTPPETKVQAVQTYACLFEQQKTQQPQEQRKQQSQQRYRRRSSSDYSDNSSPHYKPYRYYDKEFDLDTSQGWEDMKWAQEHAYKYKY